MNKLWLLFAIGTLAAVVYWGLGLAASSHFKDKAISGSDRVLSTGMLWSLASGRYEAHGKKLCTLGNFALAIGIASWVAWAVLN
ncbi:MAG: hypothetical protein EON56_05875 [Alphaproteobacteria bacterium]|nr:MAG: hypothetical protein EON56_05875 [Alphaproteobacteria bacterium]